MNIQSRLKGAAAPIAISVALLAQPVVAQDGAASAEASVEAGDEDVIIVSGTRIRSTQYDFANPLVAIDADAIQNSGVTNLTSFLTEMPSLAGSYDSNDGSGSNAGIGGVGLNLLDLRNLGTQRTLVLVDGRRHVAAVPGSASIDINTFPIDLIERVDIVSGGASAIYGADAVTGAVNFVMKDDFEGLSVRAQTGISEKGDGISRFVAVTAGQNFAGGRGNIAVSGEYGFDDRFKREQRSYFRPQNFATFSDNLDDAGDDPNVPDYIPYYDIRYFDSNPVGAVDIHFDANPDFVGNGSVWDPGVYAGGIFQSGGTGTPVSTYGGELLPTIERQVGNLLFSYDLTDNVRFFAQGKYARVDSASEGQPTFDFYLIVPEDNPFIPGPIRSAAAEYYGDVLITGRDNLDIGRRGERNKRETYRGVIGFDGDISDNLSFEVSYVYGESKETVRQTRTRFNDRFMAAIDAVDEGEYLTGTPNGNIVCRSDLAPASASDQPYAGFFFDDFEELSFTPGANSGCIPFNVFSEQQRSGAVDWLLTDAVDRSKLSQHVVSGSISGDFGESIALWGGPIAFAVGGEYRKEKSASNPDPVNTTGLTFGNALFPEVGSFDVKEAFSELRVPIVEDVPGIYDLSLNGAVRVSDYSTVGTTWTYQVGGIYAPIRDIRFRGTYAQAVRAPNIGELFGPQNQDFRQVDDPCAPTEIGKGSSTRAANCQALFNALGLTPEQIADFTGDTSASIPGLTGGNPDLKEETAKTITAGVVFQPGFAPGLRASVDFYDVKIKGAVSTPSVTTLAELCVDAPTLENVFCDAIDRNPGSHATAPGVVSGFRRIPQNVAQFRTKGVDFAVNYLLQPQADIGVFNFSLVGNYLDRLTFIAVPGGDDVDDRVQPNAPKWQANFDLNWTRNDLSITYGFNYFSKVYRASRATVASDPDTYAPEYMKLDGRFTHDAQISWAITDQFRFYTGINNLFNQKPDIGATFYPVSPVGRFYYAGVRLTLDDLGF